MLKYYLRRVMGLIYGSFGVKGPGALTDYAKIDTCQLLSVCKAGLSLLHLPAGTLAIVEDGCLIDVVDAANNRLIEAFFTRPGRKRAGKQSKEKGNNFNHKNIRRNNDGIF